MQTDTASAIAKVGAAVRDVPDFPQPGVVFKDITPVLADGELFRLAIDVLSAAPREQGVQKIIGVDARGFIFAAAVADRLGCGFVPVRKKGKLPRETEAVSYDLEYGANTVEIHRDSILPGERVWIIDDVLATGGTARAACELVRRLGGELRGISFLMELEFLSGRSALPADAPVHVLLKY